jgi:hypothetical protein
MLNLCETWGNSTQDERRDLVHVMSTGVDLLLTMSHNTLAIAEEYIQ